MTRKTIKAPQWRGDEWPAGKVQIEQAGEGCSWGTRFTVFVNDKPVGEVERFEESHSMKIKGTRLTRGSSRPRVEWRLPGERSWQGDTCGRTISRLLEQGVGR